MNRDLLIVFVKNIKLGTVKTRLAKSIGDKGAFEVYKHLVQLTEKATKDVGADKHIYFSDVIIATKWQAHPKYVQKGADLGERMKNAFAAGFAKGYQRIVLIGSDLPEINASIINQAFEELNKTDVVFGPADDGGYYLIGLNKMIKCIFNSKPWSTDNLLDLTLAELENEKVKFLQAMNDLDTIEDLKASSIYKEFSYLVG